MIDYLPAFEGDKLRLSDARKDQHLDQTERLMSHSSVNCSCLWNKNYIEIINQNLPIKITSLFRLPKIIRSIQKVLSSKTGNTNYYYIRTSHFNSLNNRYFLFKYYALSFRFLQSGMVRNYQNERCMV